MPRRQCGSLLRLPNSPGRSDLGTRTSSTHPRSPNATAPIDLTRIRRALHPIAWTAAAIAAAGGLVIVTADPAGAVRRLAVLCLQLGSYSSVLAILTTFVAIGEQRRLIRDEAQRKQYQRLADHDRQRRDEHHR